MDEIQKLKQTIEAGWVSQDKAKLINQLLNIQFGHKGEIMDVCLSKEDQTKIDTAYPEDYANRIREVLPKWNGFYNVYDYREMRVHGEMLNIAELFTKHVIQTFLKSIEYVSNYIPDETDTEHEKRLNEFPKHFDHETSS